MKKKTILSCLRNFLWSPLFLIILLGISACVKSTEVASAPQRTFFASSLPPSHLLKLCEQFLEFQKGFGILVRDHENGLLVTEWVQSSPLERRRITIRISSDPQGSVLSTHVLEEVFENQRWLPSAQLASIEGSLVQEIETYVKAHQPSNTAAAAQKP